MGNILNVGCFMVCRRAEVLYNDSTDSTQILNQADVEALDISNAPKYLFGPRISIDSVRVQAHRGDIVQVEEAIELPPRLQSSINPEKLSYCLSEDHNILDASLYHINFRSHLVNEDITDQITVNVCQASKFYILHAKSKKLNITDHLAVVFENDFTIKWKEEKYQKRHLVLHALGGRRVADETNPCKAAIYVEFFGSREEIKQQLFRGDSWEYYFSHLPQMCYVGLNSFSTLLSQIKGKDIILDAPLRWNVNEAKNKNYINCKKFVVMICDAFKLSIDKEIKTSYLEMACFKTEERRKQIRDNGWDLDSIWELA